MEQRDEPMLCWSAQMQLILVEAICREVVDFFVPVAVMDVSLTKYCSRCDETYFMVQTKIVVPLQQSDRASQQWSLWSGDG